ncbi:MAG: site-specific integrase [Pseudomonadota bacterium]
MSRKKSRKPWLHEASGIWCTSDHGKRIYLDRDYRVACTKLREFDADRKRKRQLEAQGASEDWLDRPLAALAEEFLNDIKARKKPNTYEGYRYRLLRALTIVGPDLKIGEVGKIHLAKIEQKMTGNYSPTTIKDTIATLQFAFAWAQKRDLIFENHLVGYEKPAPRKRNRTITQEEFDSLVEASDIAFARVLTALRHTGCRPGEVRSLIWDWVDLEKGIWTFPDHKTITQQRDPKPRCVPLPPEVLKLCLELAKKKHRAADHVFLNSKGKPYSKDNLCRRMSQVRKKAGIELKAGEQLVLYCNRHTFGTETAGLVTDIELANLMGHTDVRTTQRYVHLSPDRLKEIRNRVSQLSQESA